MEDALDISTRFGERLAAARIRLGISHSDLARLSGIDAIHLMQVEAGTLNIRLSQMDRLSRLLGVSLAAMVQKRPDVCS